MKKTEHHPNYKWAILMLGSLTNAIVVAVPSMSLSVLLPQISIDLNLNLVQAGLVWGISALPIVFSGFLAGFSIDSLGPKRVLILGCALVGLLGGIRGLAPNFSTLIITVFLFGFCAPFITISNVKNAENWFPDREFGLASGILSLGMALGFFTGSMVSTSIISPWLGGWRNTFLFYGSISFAFILPWLLSRAHPPSKNPSPIGTPQQTLWQGFKHITRIKNIWLLGLALLCFNGAVQGLLGYLPLYLRNLGWQAVRADGLAATFHLASMFFVIPLTLLSDSLGSRKKIILGAAVLTTLGISLVFLLRGDLLWGAVITAGLARDGFMAILIAMAVETPDLDPAYSMTATGCVLIFSGIGSLIAPPLGNKLATWTPNTPFLFWAALCAAGVACLALTKESRAP